ncbi:MAG: radical SAM protein [Candidatus Magasanikbacteria bacterium]|nr:radical SAM protein [Candidatus Magasanikbacteria bacterium]
MNYKTVYVDKEISEIVGLFKNGLTLDYFDFRFGSKNLGSLIKKMIKYKMLVKVFENELEDLHLLSDNFTSTPDITGMYVMLTDLCNYACKYCFVESPLPKNHNFLMMKVSTAKKAIRRFGQWSNKNFVRSIIFCGGEPLLNKKTLYAVLEEIDSELQNENLKLQVITNGSLVDREFANVARLHNLKVSVSIDGMANFHNSARVYQDGTATHEDAVKGYNILKDAGVSVGVSMTVGFEHVGHLVENVKWLVDNLKIKSLGFNTLMDVDKNTVVPVEYVKKVNSEMIEAFKILRDLGIYEDRLMRKIESFIEGTPYLHDCSGCGHQIVVAPNGNIGVCHGYCGWKKFFVKPTKNFKPQEHEYWKEWIKRSPINMPQCYDCEALGICGGGCPCSADTRNGSIWCVNENFCHHSKAVLYWMLEEIYKN